MKNIRLRGVVEALTFGAGHTLKPNRDTKDI